MDRRNQIPSPDGSPQVESREDDGRRHLPPVEGLDDDARRRLAFSARSREIQALLRDNQRLAASHVGLRQELAVTKQEIGRLSSSASAIKADRDAQVREIHERSLRLEAEARSVEELKEELGRLRAEIKEIEAGREELLERKKVIDCDLAMTRSELQQFSELKAEVEFLKRENHRGRNAIEKEKEMHSNNLKQSDVMEKHLISLSREEKELRSQLAKAEERAIAAATAPAPYPWPGYGVHPINMDPAYGGNQFYAPYAAHKVNYVSMPYYGGPSVPGGPSLQ